MQGRCPICGRVGALHRPCAEHPEWVHLDAEALTLRARTPLLGRVIDDRHAVVGVLGRGGFGAVFSAVHLMLGQTRAIKLLHRLEDAQARERFFAEARIVATLVSDYTVKVLDFGLANLPPLGEVPFIVMELVHGRTLHDHLRTYDHLTLGHAATLLDHVASSLDEAHRLGVIHRDLKPANIMLTEHLGHPRAKVIDFGVARIEGHERAGDQPAFGTPAYMAPEMWLIDGEVDHRSDVYALGVILFRVLAGDRPFPGTDQETLRAAHLRSPVPSLAPFGVPESVAAVVNRALAKRPVDRWSTAGEMARAFGEAVAAHEDRHALRVVSSLGPGFGPVDSGGVALLGEPLPGHLRDGSQPTPLLASGEVQVRPSAPTALDEPDPVAPRRFWPVAVALAVVGAAAGWWWVNGGRLLPVDDTAATRAAARGAAEAAEPVRVPVTAAPPRPADGGVGAVAVGRPDQGGEPPDLAPGQVTHGGEPARPPAGPRAATRDRPTDPEPPKPAVRNDAPTRVAPAPTGVGQGGAASQGATAAQGGPKDDPPPPARPARPPAEREPPSKRAVRPQPRRPARAPASTVATGPALGAAEQLTARAIEGHLSRCDCSQARTHLVRLPPDHPTTRALAGRVQRCRKPTLDEACSPP